MSSVTVFVDDAVQGHLPYVCTKTGEPADGLQRVEQGQGPGPGVFLLIFLGPIGWIVLIALSGRTSFLTVRLPMSHSALSVDRRLRRVRMIAALVALGAGVSAVLVRAERMLMPPLAIAACVAAVVAVIYTIRVSLNTVGIELDASGRWVTLRRVHPNFARAVAERPARVTADRRSANPVG